MNKLLVFIAALIFIVGCGGGKSGETAIETGCANNGAFNCRNNAVMQCDGSEWQKIEQCGENQKCNAVKGICESIDGDTTPENPDTDDADTVPDSGDSQPENPDTTQENPDTTPDDPDTEPENPDTDGGDVKPVDEESCIAAGGSWNSGSCTRSVKCEGLPENASWNKTTGIKQTWNGTEWEPSETGSYSETSSTTECVFKCNTNYSWNEEGSTCDAATHTANCTGLPANAQWNTVSEITQTWSGSAWLPSTTGTYDETSSEEECRFKCAANFTWNGSSCAADTKTANCSSKPANTVWNDNDRNGKFTQTWNGSGWDPASYASEYSKTAGTCKYVCTTGYIWSDNQCIAAPTQTASCTGLPANAQWNTASSITQTYDGSEWFPGTSGVYNETASTTECRFKCIANYNWNSSTSKCVAATQTAECTGLPANAQWNTASSITQTWNGSTWAPATTGSYNTTASSTECRYKCKTNYNWNSSTQKCIAATQQANCSSKPANTVWNDDGANGKFTQTWDGSAWMPASYASSYSKTAGTCRYVCTTGYIWSDNQCITAPTQTANCTGLPANAQWNTALSITQTYDGSGWYPSTSGTYSTTASTTECRYKCKTNYSWNGSSCVAATQTANCTGLPANASWNTVSSITQTWNGSTWAPSTTGTYSTASSTTECRFGCNMNYTWNGSSCVAATQQGNCSSKPANTVWNDNGANGKFSQTWNGTDWNPESYASSYNKTAGTCRYVCASGYIWDGVICDVAPTQTASCTGLPAAGAAWNTVSSITQTWDGEKWTPSSAGTYNDTASTTECRFKCLVHYNWNGSTCVADTKNSPCMGLPANAQWNTATSITQTWNGSTWAPSTTGTYNATASTTQCRFKCVSGYIWEDSACINTRTASCTGLPSNASWNTTTSITQTWNGSSWTPTNVGTYNETASSTECSFKCNTDYHWENSQCVYKTKTASCTGLPSNAQWNTATSITQTWNGSAWTPTTTGSFSATASTSECKYKCKTNYTWTNSVCKADSKVSNCTGLPANASWNTASTISQTWNGSSWQPSTAGTYNTTASTTECRYKCNNQYAWNGTSCIITLGKICTGQNKCYNNSEEITCPSSSSANFYGQDAQYAAQGVCTPQSFKVQTISNQKVVLDNNTGLMWQQTIPSETYTWENAVSYCDNLTYAGYSDWRLPKSNEVLTISDLGKSSPAINTTYFPDLSSASEFSNGTLHCLWTSDYSEHFNRTLIFRPYNGALGRYQTDKECNTFCVRGNEIPKASFTTKQINGVSVVIDSTTGLMWKMDDEHEYRTWQEALAYCETLTYAGYTNWRLPNKNELFSIANFGKLNTPESDFPNTLGVYFGYYFFWSSSTAYSTTWPNQCAYEANFASTDGGYGYDTKTRNDPYRVLCVR